MKHIANPITLALGLIIFGCTAGCSNHSPAIVPIGNKTIETGKTLEFEVRAVDDDGDPLQFGIEGMPAGAEFHDELEGYALFIWAPIASDAGPDGRGQDYPVTFKVSDGIDSASETVLITVTLGGAGSGSPIFVTPSDHTLDLDRTDQVKFNVEVRDPDSSSVDLVIGDNPPNGTFETAPGSKLASYRWTPSEAQIAESPVWSIRVSADDHVNPPVNQDITILLKGGNQKCEGVPPDISHEELPDQRVAGDYTISVVATDADTSLSNVGLYYLVDLGDGQTGDYSKQSMSSAGGDTYQATIPNPNLAGEATAKVSYYICATDDDDPNGSTCDQRVCLPKDGRFSFTAYAAGNNQCENDDFEINETFATPTSVDAGSFNDLKICEGDEDWFQIHVPANYWMGAGIAFTQANGQLNLEIANPDGSLLAAGEAGENQVVAYSDISQSSRDLLVRVSGATGVENNYDLVLVSEEYVPCNPDVYEPNDYPDDAKVVGEGEFDGLSCCGDPDWYKLDLNQGDGLDILIEFTNSAGDLDLWVFEPSVFDQPSLSCENAVACSATENDGEDVSIPAVPLTTTYYIAVGPYQGAKNSYIMTVLITPVQQGCQDDDDEQNDQPAEAVDIWDNGPRTGRMICSNDEDWYKTYMYAAETLVMDATFTHADGDLDMKLYDASVTPETLAQHELASSASASDNEHIEYSIQSEGEYYIRVYGYNGAENSYSLEMTIQ